MTPNDLIVFYRVTSRDQLGEVKNPGKRRLNTRVLAPFIRTGQDCRGGLVARQPFDCLEEVWEKSTFMQLVHDKNDAIAYPKESKY